MLLRVTSVLDPNLDLDLDAIQIDFTLQLRGGSGFDLRVYRTIGQFQAGGWDY